MIFLVGIALRATTNLGAAKDRRCRSGRDLPPPGAARGIKVAKQPASLPTGSWSRVACVFPRARWFDVHTRQFFFIFFDRFCK